MYEDVYFDYVDKLGIIHCYIQHGTHKTSIILNQYGTPNSDIKSKCVIFPKGKTTWEEFHRPFKDGDVLADKHGNIAIYKGTMWYNKKLANYYCGYQKFDNKFLIKTNRDGHFGLIEELHYATEEEKEKLFNLIKEKGHKWDPETKTLKKVEPKFKIGDRIRNKQDVCNVHISNVIITEVGKYGYHGIIAETTNKAYISFKYQDNYELMPNKFNINTLKPFESKVLMRSSNAREWVATFYSHYSNNKFYGCGMCCDQCIPFEGNEHLCGTTYDCDDYYKIWND